MAEAEAATDRYGIFSLGALQFGLHLDALREVVPRAHLSALPCALSSVVGGIDLRGVLVPVVDLRLALGREISHDEDAWSVVVMRYEQRLLGLLASSVGGVVDCPADKLSRISVLDGADAVIAGGFKRSDDGTLVSVLSPRMLANMPQVPTVLDQDGVNEFAGSASAAGAAESVQPSYLVLIRCGAVPFALASNRVHTTLQEPRLRVSPWSSGYCMGVIEFDGQLVPAIDLVWLCGLGRKSAGTLPVTALPGQTKQASTQGPGYFLVLDSQALADAAELAGLARLNTPIEGAAASTGKGLLMASGGGERSQILTYDIGSKSPRRSSRSSRFCPGRRRPPSPPATSMQKVWC